VAAALEHWMEGRRLKTRNLEWMEYRVQANFDEGITQAFLLEIDYNFSFENAFVGANQPIHIGSDERQ
jgi:hypothetical protein